MWTLAFIGCCLLFCVIESVPAIGRGALRGYCNTNLDCGKRKCCVSFVTPRGKRAAETSLPDHLKQFVKGKCEKRGKSSAECLVRGFSSLVNDIYYHSCPCSYGHMCKSNGQFFPPLGELGTCVKQCSSNADCRRFECCVSNTRPIGKRSADFVQRQAQGQCRPMGKRGSDCLVNNGSGKPDGIVFHSCPCVKRKTCVGTGLFDIPLGELGRCKRNRKTKS